MNKQFDLDRKVEETLSSLDNIGRAEPKAFFYTRLRARMDKAEMSFWETFGAILARPAVAMAGLCLILAFNGLMLIRQTGEGSGTASNEPGKATLVTDNEYILASNSSFDYENLDQ